MPDCRPRQRQEKTAISKGPSQEGVPRRRRVPPDFDVWIPSRGPRSGSAKAPQRLRREAAGRKGCGSVGMRSEAQLKVRTGRARREGDPRN